MGTRLTANPRICIPWNLGPWICKLDQLTFNFIFVKCHHWEIGQEADLDGGGDTLYPPLARSNLTPRGVTITTATLKRKCWTVGLSIWNCFSYDTMCYRFPSHSVTVQPSFLPGHPFLLYLPSVSAPTHLLCLTPCTPGTRNTSILSVILEQWSRSSFRALPSLSPNHPEVILFLLVLICPHPFPETSLQGCQVPSASRIAL